MCAEGKSVEIDSRIGRRCLWEGMDEAVIVLLGSKPQSGVLDTCKSVSNSIVNSLSMRSFQSHEQFIRASMNHVWLAL